MNFQPPVLTSETLDTLFPKNKPQADGDTFELGLVLGGTVSAGGFTAGVLDFLIEALDEWSAAKVNPETPPHTMKLKVITGTSGGSVTASIFASCLPFQMKPVKAPMTGKSQNLFYDIWVNNLHYPGFFSSTDLADGIATSILNSEVLDQAGETIIGFGSEGPALPPAPKRDWLPDGSLKLFMTLTNLHGIPYKLPFDNLSENYVEHGDHVRFNVRTDASVAADPAARPDEYDLYWDRTAFPGQWRDLRDYALGSAAFPLGFKPRLLNRPLTHYAYRVSVAWPNFVQWKQPDWLGIADPAGKDNYTFMSVDGGCINDKPIALAWTELDGVLGENCGDYNSKRAILLIDPFMETADLFKNDPSMLGSAFDLFFAYRDHSRYSSADLAMALDPDNYYHRFLITPNRNVPGIGACSGGAAVASAGCDAFVGFLCRDFREHDFLLGRKNAHDYLLNAFRLPKDNDLFKKWTQNQIDQYLSKDGATLPIIPLMGTAMEQPVEPLWPFNKIDLADVKKCLDQRIDALIPTLENSYPKLKIWQKIYLIPLKHVAGNDLKNYAWDKIVDALKKGKLVPESSPATEPASDK